MLSKRRVCVIGAGTAGLCALKHALAQDCDAYAYEQGDTIGGTWVYSEEVPANAKDNEIHTSMYKGLRTNLPKEIMGFPDFLYPDSLPESFVSAGEVLKFLQSYAEHFKLKPYIRLNHSVQSVRPLCGGNGWQVAVLDRLTGATDVQHFDNIFVCNGHYSQPTYPQIEGRDRFQGKQMHSHLYRRANVFKDQRVLIIGAGPSGMDIANHVRLVAEHVFLSHHLTPPPDTDFMRANVTQKGDVHCFTATGAQFTDGTTEHFTHVIYCTGYKYAFPCLSDECGLTVDENWVRPLYKHCININQPTMALIGLPFSVCPTQVFDLQVRFALKFFTGAKKLPGVDEMRADLAADMAERLESGMPKSHAHKMGERQHEYYKQLSELADIKSIKPVIGKILKDCGRKYLYELATYRDVCFKIIDDEHFVKYTLTKP